MCDICGHGLDVSLVPGSLCRKQPGNSRNLLHVGCNMAAERNLAVKDFFQCLWQRTVPFVYFETEFFSKPQNILCMRKEAEWNLRRKSIFTTITRWIAPMFGCWLKISLVHCIRLLNNLDSEISSERFVPSLPQWEVFFFGEKLHVHFWHHIMILWPEILQCVILIVQMKVLLLLILSIFVRVLGINFNFNLFHRNGRQGKH